MTYEFSVKKGDLQFIQGHWYVTHTGLVGLSSRRNCRELHTEPIVIFCDPTSPRWAFKAIVYKSPRCKGTVMASPTLLTFLFSSTAPRCAWPKRVP